MENKNDSKTEEFLGLFGLAVSLAQILEQWMIILFVAARLPNRGLDIKSSLQEVMDSRSKNTLGILVNDACKKLQLSDSLCVDLREALELRNWLIHRFYRENPFVWLSHTLQGRLAPSLREAINKFIKTTELIGKESLRRAREAGLSEQEMIDDFKDGLEKYFEKNNLADEDFIKNLLNS